MSASARFGGVVRASLIVGVSVAAFGCRQGGGSAPSPTAAESPAAPGVASVTRALGQAIFGGGESVGSSASAAATQPVALAELPPITEEDLPTPGRAGGADAVGVLISDPITAPPMDAGTRAFTAGCGEWLEFIVGGLPQLGRTPMLTSVARVQRELHHTDDLRLSLDDARRFAQLTGATHVAVGTATRAATADGPITLTYSLWNAKTGASLGAPIVRTGSSEQIRRALPEIAGEIAKRLGAGNATLPAQVDGSVAELTQIGRSFWGGAVADADALALRTAADHCALADIAALALGRADSAARFQHGTDLLLTRLAPNNALAWAQVGYMNSSALLPHDRQLERLRTVYSHNYGFAHADVWRARTVGAARAEFHAAMDAARNAPDNPDAWLSLGWTYGNEAQRLRRGRTADQISRAEWEYLDHLYPLWERAVAKAAQIDPQHEVAWERVAEAATFAGDVDNARTAYWRAEQYGRDRAGVFAWGLQMFQPKWYGDRRALDTVAEHAATADYSDTQAAGGVAQDLQSAGYPDRASQLLDRCLTRADAAIAQRPNDPSAHWDRASILYFLDRKAGSAHEYEKVASMLPNNVKAQYACAHAEMDRSAVDLAIPAFQHVLQLDPANADAMVNLGRCYKMKGRFADAEKWLQAGVTRNPWEFDGHYLLGMLYEFTAPRRHAAAAKELSAWLDLSGGGSADVYGPLIFALVESGQTNEAMRRAREAEHVCARATGDSAVMLQAAIADAYFANRYYDDAVAHGESALAISPDDTNTHEVLGDVYNALGRRADARRSWQLVVRQTTMDRDPEGYSHARAMLAKYPENGK